MANMSSNSICENKILAKISEFTVCVWEKSVHVQLSSKARSLFLNLHLLLYFVFANRKDFVETVQI